MSVIVGRSGRVLVVRIAGAVDAEDVGRISDELQRGARDLGKPLAVLALFESAVQLPTEAAKLAMRERRQLIRDSVAEVHVVLASRGFLTTLGLLLGRAAQRLSPRARATFHEDEAGARAALVARGFA